MKRMILAGVLAISLLTLLPACGGESSNNSPSAEDNASAPTAIPPTAQNTGSETTAIEPVLLPAGGTSTLLTVDDVSVFAGGVGLSTHQLALKSMAASVDPVQVEHIVSFDSLSFDTEDESRGLTLTAIRLYFETAASGRMELMVEEGPPLEHLAEDIGDVSGCIESNAAGIGSIVIFKRGER